MTRGKPLRLDGNVIPVGLYFALESTWKIAWLANCLISPWGQRVKMALRREMNDGAVRAGDRCRRRGAVLRLDCGWKAGEVPPDKGAIAQGRESALPARPRHE